MTTPRKKNVAGFIDGSGRFRPIRSPQWVSHPTRKATRRLKSKYSKAKAGDLGKQKQERALEDVFDREIRLAAERLEKDKKLEAKILREIDGDIYGEDDTRDKGITLMQFVRRSGGLNRGVKFGGKKYRGKVATYDGGEVDRLSYKQTGKRGLTTNRGGKGIDKMFQAAREAGYNVESMDDMLDKIETEAGGGSATYKTHGFLAYNPALRSSGSDPYILTLGRQKFGVYLKTYLLKTFSTKLAAQNYMKSIKAKAKANPAAARMAKAAISAFDTDFDLDLDLNDVRRLKAGAKSRKRRAGKQSVAGSRKRNAATPTVSDAEMKALQAETRRLASRPKARLRKINPVGWFKDVSPVTAEAVKKLYKKLATQYHPDKPSGDLRKMQEINADYDKAIKIAAGNEGNEFRAQAERDAAGPLREAIEFAVTLPDDIDVVIRGLWLWIEGKTYASRDLIKSFTSSDGNRFKWASKKKAWFFAAVPSSNRRGEMSFDEIDRLHGRDLVKERKRRIALNPKKKNPLDPITAFAAGASGILSALQIKERLTRRAVKRTAGKTTAQRKNPANEGYLMTLFFKNGKVRSVYVMDEGTRKPVKRFRSAAAARKFASSSGIRLVANPADRAKAKTPARSRVSIPADLLWSYERSKSGDPLYTAKTRSGKIVAFVDRAIDKTWFVSIFTHKFRDKSKFKSIAAAKNYVESLPHPNPAKVNPDRCLRCRKMTSEGVWDSNAGFCAKCAKQKPKAAATRRKKANPIKVPRRRTYEMFQGRPAKDAKPMEVSRHAPARLDQLGDLIEIKLDDGQVIKPNPKRFKLCAAGGKLWIAGGRFAKPNPAGRTNELNPIAKIDHVVYGTFKPHHGDNNYTHYIHKLGEDTGHRPTLAVDREGFPVLRGGQYKIESRGIVN